MKPIDIVPPLFVCLVSPQGDEDEAPCGKCEGKGTLFEKHQGIHYTRECPRCRGSGVVE